MARRTAAVQGPMKPPVESMDGYRLLNYQRYWQYYAGVQWPTPLDRRHKAIVVNYLAAAAQKMAGYVMSPPPEYVIDDAAATDAWDDIVATNHLATMDYEAALWTAVVGDAAYRLGWDVDNKRVSITLADPSQLWARTKADDKRVIEWVAQRYFMQVSALGQPGNAPDPNPYTLGGFQTSAQASSNIEIIEEWTKDYYRLWRAGALVQDKPNPFGFIPYILVPNNPKPGQFWGTSDFADLWPVAAEINIATSTFATIVDYSGAPVAVVEGADNTDNLRVGPGELWTLPTQGKAYLLQLLTANGSQVYTDYLDKLQMIFRDLSSLPNTVWGDVERGGGMPRSGAALALSLAPLLQAVARRRALWEDALIARCRMAWAIASKMGGQPDYAGVDVDMAWPDLLQQDTTELAQKALDASTAAAPSAG